MSQIENGSHLQTAGTATAAEPVAALAHPLAAESPCGPNLEYDPRFVSLQNLLRGREELQLGASIIPAQEPEWGQVLALAGQLMTETRDLRLAVAWTHASLRLNGLAGFAEGMELVARLLSTLWDSVHPVIESDGDAYMRASAIAALSGPDSLLPTLRDAVLLTCSHGDVSVREACQLLDGETPPGCPLPSAAQLLAAIADGEPRNGARFAALSRTARSLAAINGTLADRLDHAAHPDLSRLDAIIDKLAAVLRPAMPCMVVATGTAGEAAGSTDESPDRTEAIPTTVIQNREDALSALVRVREYFERHEPSHPAVLLIRRIERLGGSSFLDIIADLAPDSLAQVRQLAGLPQSP